MNTAADNRFYREVPGAAVDDGGPAHPVPGLQDDASFNGMSLRDYFAARAMSEMTWTGEQAHIDACATECYRVADAMLAARRQPKT